MGNELRAFNFDTEEIRIIKRDGEPWFVLKDVCNILGLSNPKMTADRLDDDQKDVSQIDTLGGKQNAIIISESGLYDVTIRSDKPQAKIFRKWITSEVIPQIRKTGGYIPIKEEMTDEELMAQALTIAQKTLALRDERIKQLKQDNFVLQTEKEILKTELDESKEWYSVKRVAHLNGISWKSISWKRLKNTSNYLAYDVKKIFDANYGNVNTYHIDIWKQEYPEFKY